MRRPRDLFRLLRFFCTRRGIATAGALISAWSVVGVFFAGGIGIVANEIWAEFKAMRVGIQMIEKHITAANEREAAMRAGYADLKQDAHELRAVVNDHERRIYRMEDRR